MAFHSAKTPTGHELDVSFRRAKYASATKSKSTWLQKQVAIHDSYEKEIIANMSDKEFAKFMRNNLKQIFGKK